MLNSKDYIASSTTSKDMYDVLLISIVGDKPISLQYIFAVLNAGAEAREMRQRFPVDSPATC